MSHGWDGFRGSSAFVACRSTNLPTDMARVVTVLPGVSVHRFVDSVRVVFSTNSTLFDFGFHCVSSQHLTFCDVCVCVLSGHRRHMSRGFFFGHLRVCLFVVFAGV